MKLLGITAHPDDEVGAFGGSLLLYRSRGVDTHVLCLTPGQAATNRGQARSDEELAAIEAKPYREGIEVRFKPTDKDLERCRDAGRELGERIRG